MFINYKLLYVILYLYLLRCNHFYIPCNYIDYNLKCFKRKYNISIFYPSEISVFTETRDFGRWGVLEDGGGWISFMVENEV